MMFKQNFLFLAVAFVFLILTCASAHAQQPTITPTPASSTEQTTGAITGQVVNERGEPMPGASIYFRSVSTPNTGQSTSADSEGRFQITGLDTGLYTVYGHSPAYVYQQLAESDGTPAYYRVGDSVRIELIKGAVITGTVTNAAGEPLVGIRVRVIRVRDAKGQPSRIPLFGMSERLTDDRGIYRLYGLMPGTYIVAAGGGPGNQSSLLNPYEGGVPTFALSSTRDTATEFTVRSGEEATVDIRYRSDPGHTISGVVKAAGLNGANVVLMPVDGDFVPAASTLQAPGARGFELNGVGDGEYFLIATEMPGVPRGIPTTIPDLAISEPRRIIVKGADISGIELVPRPAPSIAGRIALESSKAPECQGKRRPLFTETVIELQRPEKETNAGPAFLRFGSGTVSPDAKGGFIFRNLMPGRYRLNPLFYARFWYLQSISIGAPAPATPASTKIASPRIDPDASWTTIKMGEPISNVTITLAEGAASIRGRVPIGEGATVPSGAAVYLVPAETDKATDVLRYFVTNVSADGTFILNNLPPGRYWSVLQSPAQSEIATLGKLRLPESAEARTKLRRTAESLKSDLQLKPCQTLADYQLSFK